MIKSHTYFHSASGTFTFIDLTLSSTLGFFFLISSEKLVQLFWRMMEHLFLNVGSWWGQTGMNFSIYAALVCTKMPWMMPMIYCLCSLPSWRTLRRKLFLRLWQYQNVSINHDFLIFVKMLSKSATGPLRCSNVD